VGLPRLSRISRAVISIMALKAASLVFGGMFALVFGGVFGAV
jgi:hypothetical protein